MGASHTLPAEQARSIFDGLGYEIVGNGDEFSATRDWEEIRVSVVTDGTISTDGGRYRCFVTWSELADDLHDRLRRKNPGFEWAVIGVGEDGEYEVARAPPVS